MNIYTVINMDIVGSRKLNNREIIQNNIRDYLEEFSFIHKELLIAPVSLTLGDEWQIVIKKNEEAYNLFKEIESFLDDNKIKCYCGIGVGNITTKLYSDTRSMDGLAFIYAREAINIAKNSNKYYSKYLNSKENRVFFKGENIELMNNQIIKNLDLSEEVAFTSSTCDNYDLTLNRLINCIIENNEVIESKFTNKQKDTIKLYEKKGSYNLMIKDEPALSKASISQKLNTSNYFMSRYNRKIIKLLLKKYSDSLKERYNGL